MNDNPPELPDDTAPGSENLNDGHTSDDDFDDIHGLEAETEEEFLKGLEESETDIEAGRVRPARDAILEIAAVRRIS